MSEPWEVALLDWTGTGIDGARVTPQQVLHLLRATSEEEATEAYWNLDGIVVSGGVTYGASLDATRLLLSMLPSCSLPARRRALELLGQIVAGEAAENSPEVVNLCLAELRQASWFLLHGLQFDHVDMTWLYVDLIGIMGETYGDFRERAAKYLQRSLERTLPAHDRELVQNTIAGLKGP